MPQDKPISSVADLIASNAINSVVEMDTYKAELRNHLALFIGDEDAQAVVRLWVELQPKFWYPRKVAEALKVAAQGGAPAKQLLVGLLDIVSDEPLSS